MEPHGQGSVLIGTLLVRLITVRLITVDCKCNYKSVVLTETLASLSPELNVVIPKLESQNCTKNQSYKKIRSRILP